MAKFRVLAALAALLGPLAPESAAQEKKLQFTVLKDWYQARVKEPTVLVLRDQDAYAKKFEETLGRFVSPKPNPPKVDFESKQVVAICWGAMPSTGYEIEAVSATGTQKETTITVKTKVPKGITDPAITHPALAVVIPRTDRVRVVVTGDRNPPDKWWKDFANSKNGAEVIVK